MFDRLDATIKELLDSAPPDAFDDPRADADVTFATPEKGFPTQGDVAINLFLYEIKENRELRQAVPDREARNGRSIQQRAPLRIDCSYMVTAWSNIGTQDNVANSHRLLGQVLNWLSRFPVIPEEYVKAGGLARQLYAPPTMVAQMDGAKSAGEFWHALGIPPRPYFNLVVTICMNLDQQVEDPLITTISSMYQPKPSSTTEERLIVGGMVRDRDGHPVPDTWVRLEPLNQTQVTDPSGRFVFENVSRRGGLTLRARARGFAEFERLGLEIPSPTGEYDIQLRLP